MKIDDNFSPSGPSVNDARPQAVNRTPAGAAGEPQHARPGGTTDRASLSALGVALSRALEQDSPQTAARIGRIQQAVANGTYHIPSADVSARIVAAALQEAGPYGG
jgi:anti-sigma28 factor (negative regulator of flagellin synthesis)